MKILESFPGDPSVSQCRAWSLSLVRELKSQMLQLRPSAAKWIHIKKTQCIYLFWPYCATCGFLVLQQMFWPDYPVSEAQDLNYWVTREVSKPLHLKDLLIKLEWLLMCLFASLHQILLLNHCIHLVNQVVDFSHRYTENVSVRGRACIIWTEKLRINCSSDLSAGICWFLLSTHTWFCSQHNMLGVTAGCLRFL